MSDSDTPTRDISRIVSYNLRRARDKRGLTQEEASKLLHEALGKGWRLRTTLSNAENWNGRRVRRFSPNEIFAFAAVYDLPIGFFFIPFPECELPAGVAQQLLDKATDRGQDIRDRLQELDRHPDYHNTVSLVLAGQKMRRQEHERLERLFAGEDEL